ncbi:hypothetical protein BR93DRAFT_705157 [Coniochaeta sp. PMI_546]|nr:hypothetical protein BR93DRAFT_705157 [Coniochaeta sp. PMI_546]
MYSRPGCMCLLDFLLVNILVIIRLSTPGFGIQTSCALSDRDSGSAKWGDDLQIKRALPTTRTERSGTVNVIPVPYRIQKGVSCTSSSCNM